jgi:hypothetical protein
VLSTRAFTLTAAGDVSADDLRSLRSWLIDDDELRGRVELRQRDPEPGELGSLTDALMVAAGSGGALTALASVLISWLRHRTTDVTIKVTRSDGSGVEVSAQRLRGIDGPALSAEVDRLAGQLGAAGPPAVAAADPPAVAAAEPPAVERGEAGGPASA